MHYSLVFKGYLCYLSPIVLPSSSCAGDRTQDLTHARYLLQHKTTALVSPITLNHSFFLYLYFSFPVVLVMTGGKSQRKIINFQIHDSFWRSNSYKIVKLLCGCPCLQEHQLSCGYSFSEGDHANSKTQRQTHRQTKTDIETEKSEKVIPDPSPNPFIETQGLAFILFQAQFCL